MESNFNNRDFEQFVKQNADQYRMFPSEKVWRGIHNTLHTRRRWFGIGLTLLLLTIGTVTWVMVSSPGKDQLVSVNSTTPSFNNPPADQKAKIDKSNNKTLFIPGADSWQKNLPSANATTNTGNKLEERSSPISGAESETFEDIVVNNKLT